jgi:dGTPase
VPFRRLAGVTQVVGPGEGEIFHNRLTHSIKVAQVARRLAERLKRKFEEETERWGGLDPEVAEAAALAHDLGHPPFGHVSEYELNSLVSEELCKEHGQVKDREGYEGNAQSFRIVIDLAVRRSGVGRGLDLTRGTLHATLKYPWKWKEHSEKPNKYGVYGCDDDQFRFARGILPPVEQPALARSLEAQIMDWADDITYSVHDTEDFYRAGLIPLDRLASVTAERDHFRDSLLARAEAGGKPINADRTFDKIFSGLFSTLKIRERYEGTREQQELLSDFVSSNINKFITGTKLVDPPGQNGEGVEYPEDIKWEVFLLKQLIWTYVIENPSLASHQLGQRRAIQVLFKEFNDAAINVTVTAKDAYGNTATGYTGTVHFTSSDAKAVLPANYTFTSGDAGQHTFSITLKTAGSQSVTASDTVTGSITGTASGIAVNPAAASQFLLSAPSSVTHGVAFSVTLTVEDAYGNVVTGYRGTVHFSSSDSTATLPANYTFTASDAGVHTFTGLVLRKKGKQTLTVSDTQHSNLTATDTINVA